MKNKDEYSSSLSFSSTEESSLAYIQKNSFNSNYNTNYNSKYNTNYKNYAKIDCALILFLLLFLSFGYASAGTVSGVGYVVDENSSLFEIQNWKANLANN